METSEETPNSFKSSRRAPQLALTLSMASGHPNTRLFQPVKMGGMHSEDNMNVNSGENEIRRMEWYLAVEK